MLDQLSCLAGHCLTAFLGDPFKIIPSLGSLSLAALLAFRSKRKEAGMKERVLLTYASTFLFILPLVAFAFSMSCTLFSAVCDASAAFAFSIPIALGLAFLSGFFLAPILYSYGAKPADKNLALAKFLSQSSLRLGVREPKLLLIDSAKPIAYSFSNFASNIYLSIGMLELLTRKELEAVLLHELGHVKNSSSFLKFSSSYLKLSPLSYLVPVGFDLNNDERDADLFAIRAQGTQRHLNSAKRKLAAFAS